MHINNINSSGNIWGHYDMSKPKFVIVPIGGPGVGKSTVSNFLIDGKDSGRFKTSKSTEGGETRSVSVH